MEPAPVAANLGVPVWPALGVDFVASLLSLSSSAGFLPTATNICLSTQPQ